jgi:hypothetical protein
MKKPQNIVDSEIYGDEPCISRMTGQKNLANPVAVHVIFVEGPDDVGLYQPHICFLHGPAVEVCCCDEDVRAISSSSFAFADCSDWRPEGNGKGNKKWVERQLQDPHYQSNRWLCLGIVDKDFDSATGLESQFPRLGVTDAHDSEMLVLSLFTDKLDSVECLHKTRTLEKDKFSLALRLSFEFGLLKWLSISMQESKTPFFFPNDGGKDRRCLAAIKQVLITTEDKGNPVLVDKVYESLIDSGHLSMQKLFGQYAADLAQEKERIASDKFPNKCLEEFFGAKSVLQNYVSQTFISESIKYISSNSLFSGVWMDAEGRWLTDSIGLDYVLGPNAPLVFDACNGHDLERFLQVELNDPSLNLSGSLKECALSNLSKRMGQAALFNTHLFKKIATEWR